MGVIESKPCDIACGFKNEPTASIGDNVGIKRDSHRFAFPNLNDRHVRIYANVVGSVLVAVGHSKATHDLTGTSHLVDKRLFAMEGGDVATRFVPLGDGTDFVVLQILRMHRGFGSIGIYTPLDAIEEGALGNDREVGVLDIGAEFLQPVGKTAAIVELGFAVERT